MGNTPIIVASRSNLKAEAQGKKVIVTDTAAGKLQVKEHTVIREHTDQVNCVAMSPKGILASSGNDGEIMLFDTKLQKPLALREDQNNLVYALCFSPNDEGRHVITASFDKTVRIFNIAAFSHPDENRTGELKSKRLCQLLAHRKAIGCVAYSSDGRFLATGSDDETVILWDMVTTMRTKVQEVVHRFAHPGPVYAVAFSKNKLFTCCRDQGIRCFSCDTGQSLVAQPLRPHGLPGHFPLTLSASPDGTMLASGSQDRSIIVWDLSLDPPRPKFEPLFGHTAGVRSVAFSNNSSFLVSGSEDATIRIWKVTNGDENDACIPSACLVAGPILAGTDRVNSVAWSPDNNFIVSASYDSTVRVFTFACPGVVVNTMEAKQDISKLEFSDDGIMIVARNAEGGIIDQWFTTPRVQKRVEANKTTQQKKKDEELEEEEERVRLEEEARRNNRAFFAAGGGRGSSRGGQGFVAGEFHEDDDPTTLMNEQQQVADDVAAKFAMDDDDDDDDDVL